MEANAASSPKPRDAQTVEAILRSMGVERYDPRVVNQLLEVLYRYVSDVLTDARDFSDHADKPAIDVDDVRLAIRSKVAFTFTQPPPRDVTMRLAAERNAIPLPPVSSRAGVALPPPEFQLTAPNYRIILDSRKAQTPQSSPKRPRLTSSPARPGSGGSNNKARTPDSTSPRTGRVPLPRSAQSPVPMHIDTLAKEKNSDAKSPKPSVVLPPAAPTASPKPAAPSPVNTSSPVKAVTAPTRSPPTAPVTAPTGTSAEPASTAPDIIMVDAPESTTPAPATPATAVPSVTPSAPAKPMTSPIAKPATASPKTTGEQSSAFPPK